MSNLFTCTPEGANAFAQTILKGTELGWKAWIYVDEEGIDTPVLGLINSGPSIVSLDYTKWDIPFVPSGKEYAITNYNGKLTWILNEGVSTVQITGGAVGDVLDTWIKYDFGENLLITVEEEPVGFTLFLKIQNSDEIITTVSKEGAQYLLEELIYNKKYKKFVAPFVSNFTPTWNTVFADFTSKRNANLEVQDFNSVVDALGANNKDQKYLVPENWSGANEYPELIWTNSGTTDIIVYGFLVFMYFEEDETYKLLWSTKLSSPTTITESETINHTIKFSVLSTGL